MALPNVIDPKWVLFENTGKLGWDDFRVVKSNPRHQLKVQPAGETVSRELVERYRRIMADRKLRGIRDG